jgi:hypothetical protein
MANVRFDRRKERLWVCDERYPTGKGAPFTLDRDLDYESLVAWWERSKGIPFGIGELSGNEEEILPGGEKEENKMSALDKLRDLFSSDFVVDVDYNARNSRIVTDLFKDVQNMGIEYRVGEYFEDTWMAANGCGYTIDNWQYMGIKDGETEIDDCDWSYHDVLEVAEFEEMVQAAQAEFQQSQNTLTMVGVNTAPVAIVLGENLVVSGGVVVVNYKDGSSFHLEHDGKATLDVANRVVITERTFLKDGQPAYERVTVKLESLESVQSETLKLTVLEDGAKVDFTTTFTL